MENTQTLCYARSWSTPQQAPCAACRSSTPWGIAEALTCMRSLLPAKMCCNRGPASLLQRPSLHSYSKLPGCNGVQPGACSKDYPGPPMDCQAPDAPQLARTDRATPITRMRPP